MHETLGARKAVIGVAKAAFGTHYANDTNIAIPAGPRRWSETCIPFG